jgi:thiol-disulfide isomerase/thioredoxin
MRSLLPVLLTLGSAFAGDIRGLWDATVTVNNLDIPFRIEFRQDGKALRAAFFNGEERVESTSGQFADGQLDFSWAHYATRLEARVENGELVGRYGRVKSPYAFRAHRYQPVVTREGTQIPSVAGWWEIAVKSPKGESAWKLIVRQAEASVSAAVLRVDGDTGELSGQFHDGKFTLSHFSGARPSLWELTPRPDGTLEVVQNRKSTYVARRVAQARAENLPAPTDPSRHTSVKDPSEPLRFSGTTLDGQTVTQADARFQGRVVVVNVSGSWCPNCHDEAPFLAELYAQYRAQGLEIVTLSFEEEDQLANPTRLRAFIEKYGLRHTVLLSGIPDQVRDRLPQAVNLNTWPATFFLGRDGRVRSAHAGFAGKVTGAAHEETKAEIRATIERLLAEQAATTN